MHWLRSSKNKNGFAALNLNMSKAYDRVEWPFMRALITKVGFSARWVKLIMDCVTSVSYSFNVNDQITKAVLHSRG